VDVIVEKKSLVQNSVPETPPSNSTIRQADDLE
jgi:hypothetical protein